MAKARPADPAAVHARESQRLSTLLEVSQALSGTLNLRSALLPAPAADPWDSIDLTGPLNAVTSRVSAEAERRKILRTLKENSGDRARTADVLQVGYRTLLVRMKELGIEEK